MMTKDKASSKQSEQPVNYVDQRPSLNIASSTTTSSSNEYSSEQRELDSLQGQEFVQQGYQAKETSTEVTSTDYTHAFQNPPPGPCLP
uniref:Uncharacterized protein n=1 Tax=Ditylenchus dipsaci TaxID=166011 RepID=A0A915DG37_9BILA